MCVWSDAPQCKQLRVCAEDVGEAQQGLGVLSSEASNSRNVRSFENGRTFLAQIIPQPKQTFALDRRFEDWMFKAATDKQPGYSAAMFLS